MSARTALTALALAAGLAAVPAAAAATAAGTVPHRPAASAAARSPRPVVVPAVVGLTRARAVAALRAAGLRPTLSGVASGKVTRQSPAAGARVKAGSTVAASLQLRRRPAAAGSRRSDGVLVPALAASVIALVLLLEYAVDRRRRREPARAIAVPAVTAPCDAPQPRTFVVPHTVLEQIERDKLTRVGR
jgi:hypothetical protein